MADSIRTDGGIGDDDGDADELEELDICARLSDLDSRLYALALALSGAGIASDIFLALSALVDDMRDRCDELDAAMRAQDAAKRARGEPRAGRVFFDEPGEKEGRE